MGNSYWYYSQLKVSILQWDNEFINNIEIPFVSSKQLMGHKVMSFPITHKAKHASLQIQVSRTVVINPLSGNTSQVNHLYRQTALVCPPVPVYHYSVTKHICSAAIKTNVNVYKSCNVHVKSKTKDAWHIQGVND